MKKSILVLVLLAVCSSSLVAAPLNKARVSSLANWVVHLDVDQLGKSTIGKLGREEIRNSEIEQKLQGFAQVFSFHPLDDIQNITLCGRGKDPHEAVAIAQGKYDQSILTSLVSMNPFYETSKHGEHTIHSWIDEKQGSNGQRQYGAFYGSDTVLISMGELTLQHVLDVFDGEANSMMYNYDLADFEQEHPGMFLLIAAQNVNEHLDGIDDSGLLQQTERFALAVGEDDASTYVDLTIQAVSYDATTKIAQILTGLKAFVTLAITEEAPELAKLAESIEIGWQDDVVRVHLDWDSKKLVSVLKEIAEKHEAEAVEAVSTAIK
ncbi:MAG: hypothetical protein JXA82_13590 [Sedimentisphaerales bacterium]|nr:hypothetical protein [Sedimentisphaerales bacterium]